MCDCDGISFGVVAAGRFNNDSTIAGNVAANSPGGMFRVAKNVFMPDGTYLAADNVEVGNASNVYQVFTNKLKRGEGAVIRNGVGPVATPIASPFCVAPLITCGGPDVYVAPGTTLGPLAPGIYGRLQITNGAKVTLAPGEFTFCDVKMGRQTVLEAEGNVILKITMNLRVGTASTLGPIAGFPPTGIYVGGRKVRISQSARVKAAIVAPNAKIAFGRDAGLDGCFCAAQAKSDKHITLTCIE